MKRIGRYNRTDDGIVAPAIDVLADLAHELRYNPPRALSGFDALLLASALDILCGFSGAQQAYGAKAGIAHILGVLRVMRWRP